MSLVIIITILVLTLLFITLFYSPLIIMFLEVEGRSMLPTFQDGQSLVAIRPYLCRKLKIGDIVVANPNVFKQRGREHLVIKRIKNKVGSHYFIVGDNADESYDSRDYGWVSQKEIVAKVITKKERRR